VRWAIVECCRQVGCLSGLAVCAPDGCAKITERVPCLLDQEHAVARVSDANVDRSGRIRRAGGQLEGPGSARCSRQLEEALLHREVPRIGGFSRLAEGSRERDRKRTSEGHPKRDPQLELNLPTSAEFDAADPRLMDADACPELSLGEMEANASRPHGSR
jgi:hypothetical protein